MLKKHFVIILLIFSLFANFTGQAYAEEKQPDKIIEMEQKIDLLQEQLKVMQDELEKLKKEKEESKPVLTPQQEDEELLRQLQEEMLLEDEKERAETTPRAGNTAFNPEISVNVDFLWNLNHNKRIDGGSPFNIREAEIAFQSKIDPWSDLNVFAGIHNENGQVHTHLEEAYATFYKLPLGLQMKAGKFLTAFGKDNLIHQHDRPYVDMPNAVRNFLGDEGMAGTGLSASAIIPLGNIYGEVILEAINDENSASFTGGSSGKLLYNGHLRLYADLNDSSNLELGYSHLRGFNDEAVSRLTKLNGVDLTYRWRPVDRGRYNSLLLRGEYFWSDRENNYRSISSSGYYGHTQYQLNRNWYIGCRYDYSEFPNLIDANERAISGILTYYPTEFSYYRLQYKKTDRNYALPLEQWLFQMNFLIGPHGAHKF